MPDTDLSAALDGMRRRAQQITGEHDADDCDLDGETCTGHDAERLLAAVDAALDSHPVGRRFRKPHDDICRRCGTPWPCVPYKAISRALLGEDGQ